MPSLANLLAHERDGRWPAGAHVLEFDDEKRFVNAVGMLRDKGYTEVEAYTPYPVDALDAQLPEPPSVLPVLVFLAGLGGAVAAYWIQWFANVASYPLNIGGRPAHAVPAFFVPTFEGAVLVAAGAAFFGLVAVLRLPRPWHPIFEVDGIERSAIDRYFIAISASDAALVPRDLQALGAVGLTQAPPTR